MNSHEASNQNPDQQFPMWFNDVAENDIIRQKALEDAGFKVLRFDDDEVLFSINGVYQEIEAWISEKEAR